VHRRKETLLPSLSRAWLARCLNQQATSNPLKPIQITLVNWGFPTTTDILTKQGTERVAR